MSRYNWWCQMTRQILDHNGPQWMEGGQGSKWPQVVNNGTGPGIYPRKLDRKNYGTYLLKLDGQMNSNMKIENRNNMLLFHLR